MAKGWASLMYLISASKSPNGSIRAWLVTEASHSNFKFNPTDLCNHLIAQRRSRRNSCVVQCGELEARMTIKSDC
jgi:hypothetical protein